MPTANFRDDGAIVLNQSAPLSTTYEVDVKAYKRNISNQKEGQAFVEQTFSKEHISLILDYAAMKVTITLDQNKSATSGWEVKDWNQHLQSN